MKVLFSCLIALLLVSVVEADECRLQEQLFEKTGAVNQYGGPVLQKLYSCDGRLWFTEPPVVYTHRQSVVPQNYNGYYDRPKHTGYKDLFRVHVQVETHTRRGFVPPRYEYNHRRSHHPDHSRPSNHKRRSSDYRYSNPSFSKGESAFSNDGPAFSNDGPAFSNDGSAFK